jgi:hypothetical protein
MNKNHNASHYLDNNEGENRKNSTQLKTIFEYLKSNVATASMISNDTGVPQKCITRYKRDLEKVGKLWELKKTYCKKTGYKAWYLTTNVDLIPKELKSQLNLFDDEG